MAIGISISTSFGSSISCDLFQNSLLTIQYSTHIQSGRQEADGSAATHVYERGVIQFHGTRADLRTLAERILAATANAAPEPEDEEAEAKESIEIRQVAEVPEPACECVRTDADAVDTRGCPVHGIESAEAKAIRSEQAAERMAEVAGEEPQNVPF